MKKNVKLLIIIAIAAVYFSVMIQLLFRGRSRLCKNIWDYMACVASVDESVGEILDYLKRTGLDGH